MSTDFNAKNITKDFIDCRERYLKSRINKHRFYSEKYQFLFGVEFTKENNNSPNCSYYSVDNLDQCFEILVELDVYELDKAKEKLFMINRSHLRGCDFPCYFSLCEKFIRLDP